MALSSSYPRDANFVPVTDLGTIVTKSLTLTGTGTVVSALFTLTGTVQILALYGVVTTDLGANHAASAWRLNDQTSQVYLTAVGGTDISAAKAGSVIYKKALVATALTYINNGAGAISEGNALETEIFTPVIITKKTGALTQIEYRFTTTDNPTSGVIKFYAGFIPLSDDGNLTAV